MDERLGFRAAKLFCDSPLWNEAIWIATTYRVHPTSEAPPVMGLVFADWTKGVNLFRTWPSMFCNIDKRDDIRVAVIEGSILGQNPGYSIRIAPAREPLSRNELQPTPIGQVQRMHPLPDNPDMLQDFKREYLRHGEFLLAPVVHRDDDQLYFNVEAGIIKQECVFRYAHEILDSDADAIVLAQPRFPF